MRAAAPSLALVALLAGCVAPLEGTPPPSSSAEAMTLAWSLESCRAAVGVVPVPAASLAAHLPPGFTPLAPADIGLPPDPRGDAVIAFEVFRCAAAHAGGETVEDAAHGGVFTFVDPPAELVDPEVDFFHFYRWDTLLASSTMRAFFAEAGAPVFDGTASISAGGAPGGGGPLQAMLDVNGTSFTLVGASQGQSGSFGGTFKEFFATAQGFPAWKTTGLSPFGQGAGTVQASGGLGEALLGGEPVAAYVVFVEDVSFVNGTASRP